MQLPEIVQAAKGSVPIGRKQIVQAVKGSVPIGRKWIVQAAEGSAPIGRKWIVQAAEGSVPTGRKQDVQAAEGSVLTGRKLITFTPSTIKTLKNPFLIYLLKFAGIFCLCYFGTLAVIGLAAPGGWYSPFVEKYLDYVRWIKVSLMQATGLILSFFHIKTTIEPGFVIKFTGGRGVIIAMSCVGYGVYSFWIAFVAANEGSFLKKIRWVIFGVLALWFINVIRITLFLTAINKGWPMPLGIDHHTWFNIFAYTLIFLMIWLFDKSLKNALNKRNPEKNKAKI